MRVLSAMICLCIAHPVTAQVAEVSHERVEHEPYLEDIRIYTSDGSHLDAQMWHQLVTVTFRHIGGGVITEQDHREMEAHAVRCTQGSPTDMTFVRDANWATYSFTCSRPN